MIISTVLLTGVGFYAEKNFSFILNQFWFASGLLLLVLLSLIDQPHFSKDANIFVNGITAALSLLLLGSEQHDVLFWVFLCYTAYLIISSYILMWKRNNPLHIEGKAVQFFSRLNRQIGKPEVIFSAFFLWGAVKQYTLNSSQFNALLWFWAIFMLLNIPLVATTLESLFDKKSFIDSDSAVGKIFGVQSKNTFLVKLLPDRKEVLNRFDLVEFQYKIDNKQRKGIIVDVYLLNQEQWVKVLCTNEIENLSCNTREKYEPDIVYKSNEIKENDFTKKFIGIICENTVIEKIQFVYNSKIEIYSGSLVEVRVNSHKILYQIVQGVIRVEQLESKNETGLIVAEAIQLGEWNSTRSCFERFGWVPEINTPVFISETIKKPDVGENELEVGIIPGTNYPAILNLETAVTHHTAVLGITGSGKSVFTRNLTNEISKSGTKVIVIDLTGEYRMKYKDITVIIDDENERKAFYALETLAAEKAKWPREQNKSEISKLEETIRNTFGIAIKKFLESDSNISVFELSDISNNTDNLEYVRWFFTTLFFIAKNRKNYGKKICVVLEEAHTLIPEWNFAGSSDKGSQATVNSIAQIALQGRKYNIGFIVIAQRTANVSKTVLTQCNTVVVFQELDKTTNDFLGNYLSKEFLDALPSLKFRTAIAVGKAFKSSVPMIFEIPFIEEKYYEENGKPVDSTEDFGDENKAMLSD